MMKIAAAGVTLLVAAATAQAQVPVTLELRGGAAFPTQDLGTAELKTGAGFEGSVRVNLLPQVGLYGGWSWHSFVMDKPFNGAKYDVEDTGYIFGLQLAQPLFRGIGGFVQGGGIYKHIEFENAAGDIVADTGHKLGWEAGGGFSVPVAPSFAITPGVRYRSLSTDVTIGSTTTPVDLRYVAAEIGISWTYGAPRPMAAVRTR